MLQKTIKKTIEFSGVGLHTGCNVRVRVTPAGADSGITFIRTDIPGSLPIKAEGRNVVNTNYATTLGRNGVTISTVEHILAAFYGLGVDNASIEIKGPEVPVLDGSAEKFIEMIEAAGIRELNAEKLYLVIKRPINVSEGDKYVLLMPTKGGGVTIDYSIDFSHPFLNKQTFSGLFSRDVFKKEIGSARTFGFLQDVEKLRANGLARGGSLSNAVVVGETDILNKDGLRYPDEFVRHKVLDLMGDLSLAGAPISGRIVAHRSGHALNHKLIQKIMKQPSRWELKGLAPQRPAKETGHVLQKAATL
ncbi:MAG: UDP-3-O-acyl-N-acetylglucosamine deacetylase [Thermodesulfobacteriota bacterium]|nr:MAG: UDP-3-O-acyl-N-acetylglucosamine deacetylase [Thermodesulfobacteriota bacterium]